MLMVLIEQVTAEKTPIDTIQNVHPGQDSSDEEGHESGGEGHAGNNDTNATMDLRQRPRMSPSAVAREMSV